MAAIARFKFRHFLIRFGAALALVFATYNPVEPYSYFEWALAPLLNLGEGTAFSVFKAFVGLLLVVGWTIFIRATSRSVGPLGLSLAFAYFVLLVLVLYDRCLVSP